MEGILAILGIIWCILCLVLFFKVQGMCNNVSRIWELLENKHNDNNGNIVHSQKSTKNESQQKRTAPIFQFKNVLILRRDCSGSSPELTHLPTYPVMTGRFSVSQMSRMKFASILPWRGKARRQSRFLKWVSEEESRFR